VRHTELYLGNQEEDDMYAFDVNEFDMFMFLLSSDWGNKILSLEMNVDEGTGNKLKLSAREAVTFIISKIPSGIKNYNRTDFSDSRINKTIDIFFSSCKKYKLNSTDVDKFVYLIKKDIFEKEDDNTLSAFWLIINGAIRSSNGFDGLDVPRGFIDCMVSVFNFYDNFNVDFESLEMSSNTEWDKHIRNYFPDVSTAVSDFCFLKLGEISKFRYIWKEIFDRNENKKYKYIFSEWLKERYRKLISSECHVPRCMM
jgi:hypothetical protein